jgi:hypothetical protein
MPHHRRQQWCYKYVAISLEASDNQLLVDHRQQIWRTTDVNPHRRASTTRYSVAGSCLCFAMGGVEYRTPDGSGPGKVRR